MKEDLAELLRPAANVPHLEEYFGVWSIMERPFQAAVDRVSQMDLALHIQQQQGEPKAKAYDASSDYEVTQDGVAVIELVGPMMKYASSLSGGTSTVLARRQLRNAANNPAVRGILLFIDSPGGTSAGTADLAAEVAAAARRKPTVAYIEDLGASAAYWAASQASKIYANATAAVGSIGTYAVIEDLSQRTERMGITVHVLRAGEFKGAGVPGTKITDEQLAEWQRLVNEINSHFVAGVVAGRRMDAARVAELADGRVHIGAAAQRLGLIDKVGSLDEALRDLSSQFQAKGKAMSETLEPAVLAKPQAATYEDIKACCPGCDNDFVCGQLGRKATIDQAQSAWMELQQQRIEAAQQELAQARAAAEKPGVEALGTRAAEPAAAAVETGDVLSAFEQAVRERMGRGMSRQQAVRDVVTREPELHRAFLHAHNEQYGRRVVGAYA